MGPGYMPKVTKHTLTSLRAIEYGHGSYGVVMPTLSAKGWIVKVTSDPSEAHTVVVYHKLPRKPEGIVRYGPIFKLPRDHDGRPMYVLWREEAFDVGKVFGKGDEVPLYLMNSIFDETIPTCKAACSTDTPKRELDEIRRSATQARGHTGYEDGQSPNWWKKFSGNFASMTTKAGRGLAVAQELAQDLTVFPKFEAIGKAMLELMKQGILVTDVHSGNFGYVKRRGRRIAAITDPGNVAFLTTKYDGLKAPSVMSGLSANVKSRIEQKPKSHCAT